MKAEIILTIFIFVQSAAARGVPRPTRPGADALLVAALSAPTTGYTAKGRIQSFAPGRKTKALGMMLYVLPGGRLRREVRARANLPTEQIFVDDGSEQRLYWPRLETVWTGMMPRETAGELAERLKSLYTISVSPGGRVAKHATWRLNFSAPDGLLRRSWWVDRSNGQTLKSEEYRLDGTLLRRERLSALTPENPDPALFRLAPPSGTAFAPRTAPRGPAIPGALFPRWIPDGFLALESHVEDFGPTRALVIGYGDGMETFTLREENGDASPTSGEKKARPLRLKNGSPATLLYEDEGPRLEFHASGRACSIAGNIPEDEMLRMADSFASLKP